MQLYAKLLDVLKGGRKQLAQPALKRSEFDIWFVRLWAFRQARWSASRLPVPAPVTYANPPPPPPGDLRIYSKRRAKVPATDRRAAVLISQNMLPLHTAVLFI